MDIKPVVFDAKFMLPNDIVDDVICRFLLNIPKEEKFDPIRVCFQVELAHWYFLDYYCGEGCSLRLAQLKNMPYNQFAYIMFQKTPHLKSQLPGIDKHLAAFKEYKMRVPTFGAILMNQSLTKAVLVQGFRNHWGFPKGKVNEGEDPVACAIREVFEETGYDISPLVNEHHYIESKVFERNDRLYLVRGVDTNFKFEPQTLFEIKNIKWFNISELPEHKKDTNPSVAKSNVPISNFYSVYPYVKRLKMWIADKLEGKNKIQHFKVRDGETPQNVLTQKMKSHPITTPTGKILEPFQFPQHFLQSGGGASVTAAGWQLFPMAQAAQQQQQQPDVKPNLANLHSSALQELLFGVGGQQNTSQQARQGSGDASAALKPSKNARRRLFPEGQGGSEIGVIGKPRSYPLDSSYHEDTKPNIDQLIKNQHLNAPAWVNFAFDREKVYKAFFTPPQPTFS